MYYVKSKVLKNVLCHVQNIEKRSNLCHVQNIEKCIMLSANYRKTYYVKCKTIEKRMMSIAKY